MSLTNDGSILINSLAKSLRLAFLFSFFERLDISVLAAFAVFKLSAYSAFSNTFVIYCVNRSIDSWLSKFVLSNLLKTLAACFAVMVPDDANSFIAVVTIVLALLIAVLASLAPLAKSFICFTSAVFSVIVILVTSFMFPNNFPTLGADFSLTPNILFTSRTSFSRCISEAVSYTLDFITYCITLSLILASSTPLSLDF